MKKLILIICILIIPIVYGAGVELVTNGAFTTNCNDWTFDDPPFTCGNDEMDHLGDDTIPGDLSQTVSVSSGETHNLTYTISNWMSLNELGNLRTSFCGNANIITHQGPDGDEDGTFSFKVACSSTANLNYNVFYDGSDTLDFTLDDVSVKQKCVNSNIVSSDCTDVTSELISGDVLVDGVTWTVRGATVNIDG